MHYEEIKSCRICGHDKISEIYNFGEMASCGYFAASREERVPRAPIVLVRCNECHLVQLKHNYHQDDLFRHTYGYRSGLNEAMQRHLNEIATRAISLVKPEKGDVILDIGSNDCTLLNSYQNNDLHRIGIDPTSDQFKEYYPPNIHRLPDFFTAETFQRVFPTEKAKIITSISMFYDLPDPNQFVADIAKILEKEGVWIFEQSYLPTMLEKKSFDTICHEHLEYYGLYQIITLLAKHKLRIFDVEFNDINGGSFRLYACHDSAKFVSNSEKIKSILEKEKQVDHLLQNFVKDMEKTRDIVTSFLETCKKNGKVVHGYGASTKGNTLLQYCNITSDTIGVIADRNPQKWGHFTPGSSIPIVSEEESHKAHPDYLFVLPWHFREEFLKREAEFRKAGGKFFFPLPHGEIV